MTAARRCSACDVNWPDSDKFKTCALCKRYTWRGVGEKSITLAEATTLATDHAKAEDAKAKVHADFELYYANREARRLRAELDAGVPV